MTTESIVSEECHNLRMRSWHGVTISRMITELWCIGMGFAPKDMVRRARRAASPRAWAHGRWRRFSASNAEFTTQAIFRGVHLELRRALAFCAVFKRH
jgi:hypothetical protein